MTSPLKSLIGCGTKLWLDSIDPDLVERGRALGVTGATSNPVIVSDLIATGRFDAEMGRLMESGLSDSEVAWRLTDQLVRQAQEAFLPAWHQTLGDDGYVSFEVDPLLEDPEGGPPHAERVARYVELGKAWSEGQPNRMIKIPATAAGLDALEPLCAAGVTLNVTLIFSSRQYRAARDAVWRGARKRGATDGFKSVYSIFVSRVDVYTGRHVTTLSPAAQGEVGIVGAKRIWAENRRFWSDKHLERSQEIIFASTGTKRPEDPPWKYVEAFAGSDIETNPPATNDAVEASGRRFQYAIDRMPSEEVLAEIDAQVDVEHLERTLMEEGVRKFVEPQKALLERIAEKRAAATRAG